MQWEKLLSIAIDLYSYLCFALVTFWFFAIIIFGGEVTIKINLGIIIEKNIKLIINYLGIKFMNKTRQDYTRREFEEAAKAKQTIVFESILADTPKNIVVRAIGTIQIGNIPIDAKWDSQGKCWSKGKRSPKHDLFAESEPVQANAK